VNHIISAPAPIFDDISTADPIEIDGHLARLGAEADRLEAAITRSQRKIAQLREMPEAGREYYAGTNENEQEDLIRQAQERLTEISFHFVALNAEYARRGGWSRYYLVEDGHLHYDVSGSRCSRIPSTTHYWMTEFSGMPSKMVIAKAQDRVCTTCFPDAPVVKRSPHPRFMTLTEAEKAAHAEEKARKAAAKKAAQITTPEGGELIVQGSHIKTERAAWNRAMADATTLAYYGEKHADGERAAIELCLAALAHRRGVTVESLREELNKKIAAKGRREGFTPLATA
jgi:hypothetical protein